MGLQNSDHSAWIHSRTALSEKKPTVKVKSPEKSKPDEKDPEKSPTKKQEGNQAALVWHRPCLLLSGRRSPRWYSLLAVARLTGLPWGGPTLHAPVHLALSLGRAAFPDWDISLANTRNARLPSSVAINLRRSKS
jgi:hypothetical protein